MQCRPRHPSRQKLLPAAKVAGSWQTACRSEDSVAEILKKKKFAQPAQNLPIHFLRNCVVDTIPWADAYGYGLSESAIKRKRDCS